MSQAGLAAFDYCWGPPAILAEAPNAYTGSGMYVLIDLTRGRPQTEQPVLDGFLRARPPLAEDSVDCLLLSSQPELTTDVPVTFVRFDLDRDDPDSDITAHVLEKIRNA